jgi:hypothetical protein
MWVAILAAVAGWVVAEGVSDDRCWHFQDVLSDRGCAGVVRVGTPSLWTSAARVVGRIGCPARRRPGTAIASWV